MQFFKESDIQSLALQEYRKFITSNKVVEVKNSSDAAMVKRVGERIARAVTSYYTDRGLAQSLEGFNWEYNLIDSKEVNAWCMPGGKIVVYTGLLPITQNENALGVVMGHEVAHALAKHGNERMSQATLQQLGGVALSVAVADKTQEAQRILLDAYGIGTTVGAILPFSRKHELEADKLGLMYAALAGFDPREAIPLWQRMEKASQGQKQPEFLSTHPSESNRIDQLNKLMPEALTYYKPINQANK
jgi:predicted Zn-dependent protease